VRPSYVSMSALSPFLFLASVLPTAILLVLSAVVVPACVAEGAGPLASMRRSIALTKGHRLKIFAMLLLLAVVSVGAKLGADLVGPDDPSLGMAVDAAWSVPLLAYCNAAVVMTYHGLRVAKEGAEPGQVAEIFD